MGRSNGTLPRRVSPAASAAGASSSELGLESESEERSRSGASPFLLPAAVWLKIFSTSAAPGAPSLYDVAHLASWPVVLQTYSQQGDD